MSASPAKRVTPVPGIPCWVNLIVGDLSACCAFYAAVLGWEFTASSLGDQFVIATSRGDPVAGIGVHRPGFAPASVWTPYFAVRDADVTAARIQERSATLAVGPMAVGEGRAGVGADRDGATFGFWKGPSPAWSAGEGSAPTSLDLQTRDVFDAAVFYGEVFDWATEPGMDIVYRDDHVLVERNGRAVLSLRGGGLEASEQPHLRPRWLVNFTVDDVEHAVVAALRAGGGRPHPPAATWASQGFSRTLQDPEGGLFTLTHRTD
ncbi:VOC family protein [Streptomyces sp. NPDC048560]|uniref:VOC family protein n=1 Tax=Streptomyces sp. NPDC048560 TaxID=3155488 RepID=UPI00342AEAF7